ncbi:MAG TPA: fibronectin type III domain-containing protein, partial [Steroidobacteraceae bacterium]|nr:fibronectin type III domain-containing protein [Steroidobacteraceae bacterium]
SNRFNPGGFPTAMTPGFEYDDPVLGVFSAVSCSPASTSDSSYAPADPNSFFQSGTSPTNESFAVYEDPGYLATGGYIYFFVPNATADKPATQAAVVIWTLTNGDVEVELDQWCTSGTTSGSTGLTPGFQWGTTVYSGGCSSPTNDFLFDSSGNLIGYVDDEANEEGFTGKFQSPDLNVIMDVPSIPADLAQGASVNDFNSQNVVPLGAKVTAIGSNSITLSEAATTGVSSDAFTYYPWTIGTITGSGPASIPGWSTMPLSAPTGLAAASTSSAVTTTWNAVAGAASYNLYGGTSPANLGLVNTTGPLTSPTFAFTEWPPGYANYLAVQAVYPGGYTSDISAQILATALPAVPSTLSASATGTAIALQWTAGAGASSYSILEGSKSGAESGTPVVSGITSTSYTLGGQAAGGTYFFEVEAVNAGGNSQTSNEASATLAPSAPTGVSAVAGNAMITLNWTASAGATSYSVYEGTASGQETGTPVTSVTGPGAAISGLANGRSYYFTVTATNAGGTSAESAEVNAAPAAPASNKSGGGGAFDPTDLLLLWILIAIRRRQACTHARRRVG